MKKADKHLKIAKVLLESGHVDEAIAVLKTALNSRSTTKEKKATSYIHRPMRYSGPATEDHLSDILFDIRMRILGVQQFGSTLMKDGGWSRSDFDEWSEMMDDAAYSLMNVENKLDTSDN